MPTYPKSARRQRLQGDVLVRVLISEKGKIVRAVAQNGPQSLRDAAEKAVSHWRYVPYIEDGKPVVVQTWVTFHFELKEG
jgi:protein TonB